MIAPANGNAAPGTGGLRYLRSRPILAPFLPKNTRVEIVAPTGGSVSTAFATRPKRGASDATRITTKPPGVPTAMAFLPILLTMGPRTGVHTAFLMRVARSPDWKLPLRPHLMPHLMPRAGALHLIPCSGVPHLMPWTRTLMPGVTLRSE